MAKRTKVVGLAARWGARYGATLRKRAKEILEKRYSDHVCPRCRVKGKVVRISVGLWMCKKCGLKFAGGAYVPRTGINKQFSGIIIEE